MARDLLLALLWAIFLAEGDCKASVPFGWLPLKERWKKRQVGFGAVLKEVVRELRREWRRWQRAVQAGRFEGDFVRWLARVGYNANPAEWVDWEKNVRFWLSQVSRWAGGQG